MYVNILLTPGVLMNVANHFTMIGGSLKEVKQHLRMLKSILIDYITEH